MSNGVARSVWVAAIVGGLTTLAVAAAAWRSEQDLVRAEFEAHASVHRLALLRRAERALEALLAVEGLWASSRDVEHGEFRSFVRPLLDRHPELRALEWIPRVDDLEGYQSLARLQGLPLPWRLGPEGTRLPVEGPGPVYPVHFAEPSEQNAGVFGYDLGSEPVRAAALTRAGAELRPVSTPPLALVQSPETSAVLTFEPIHRTEGRDTPDFSDDRQEVIGFAASAVDLQTLLDLADQDAGIPEMSTALHAGAGTEAPLVARSARWTAEPARGALSWSTTLPLPGQDLAISYRADPAFRRHAVAPETAAALLTGMALTTALVLYLSRSTQQTGRLRAVSEEIKAANAALERQVQERARAEEALRTLNEELNERVLARTADLMRQGDALVQANQRLGDSEAQLRLLLEHFAGAAWTVDEDLNLLFSTGALAAALLGTAEGPTPLARALREPALVEPVVDAHRRALTGEERTLEVQAAGRTFELRVGRSDPRLGGALVAVALDITERRRLERDRGEARRQAEERLQSLGMLAGGIAHDFNNLLTTILGNAGLAILGSEDRPGVLKHLERIELAAQRAAELTQGLLTYTGRGQEPLAPLDIHATLSELPKLVGPAHLIELDLPPELPPVAGDASQLRPFLLNLVKNAVEALREPTAKVRVSAILCELIRPDALEGWASVPPPPGTYVKIAVIDQGVGMDEQTRRRIFEPFFSTKSGGWGFGLAAALGLLRRHEGAIRVESAPGVGTRMEVYLPPSESSPSARSELVGPMRVSGGRVLVVDDEQPIRELVRTVLVQAGFDVVEATDGDEAVERVRAEPGRFSVVLMDMMMPRMTGAEALEEIRRVDPRLPVVLSSGFSGAGLPARLAQAPHLRHLPKPYRARELIRVLRESIEQG